MLVQADIVGEDPEGAADHPGGAVGVLAGATPLDQPGGLVDGVAADLALDQRGEVLGERYLLIGSVEIVRMIDEICALCSDFVLN